MSADSGVMHEALEEGKQETEELSIEQLSAIIEKKQSEIDSLLHHSIEAILAEKDQKKLLDKVIEFCNDSMSNALVKKSYGDLVLKLYHSSENDSSENVDSEVGDQKEGAERESLSARGNSSKTKTISQKALEAFIQSLKKKQGFEFLIEILQKQLETFFRRLQEDTLGKLYAIFYALKRPLEIILESSRFFARSPEVFPLSDNENEKETLLARYANNISEFILSIRKALAIALEITIETPKVYTKKDINNIEEVPPFFVQYLQSMLEDPLNKDPCGRHLATIPQIVQAIQKKTKIKAPKDLSLAVILKQGNSGQAYVAAFSPTDEGLVVSNSSIGFIEESSDPEDWVMVMPESNINPPVVIQRNSCNLNSFLALVRRGPLIKLSMGLAINHALSQFFTVYPETYNKARPYFIVGDIIGIAFAILDGRQAVLYLANQPKKLFRIIEAFSEGLQVFIFTLGGVVKGVVFYQPTDAYISNLDFYTELVPGPLVISILYTVLYSAPRAWDECSQRNRGFYFLKMGLHTLASFLLFGSIFQNSMINFFKKSSAESYLLYDLLIPSIASFVATVFRVGTPYGESVRSFLSCLSLGNLCYMLSKQIADNDNGINYIVDYVRVTLYGVAGVYSLVFMYLEARHFLLHFDDNVELITRRIRLPQIQDGQNASLQLQGINNDPNSLRTPLLTSQPIERQKHEGRDLKELGENYAGVQGNFSDEGGEGTKELGEGQREGQASILYGYRSKQQGGLGQGIVEEVSSSTNRQESGCCGAFSRLASRFGWG